MEHGHFELMSLMSAMTHLLNICVKYLNLVLITEKQLTVLCNHQIKLGWWDTNSHNVIKAFVHKYNIAEDDNRLQQLAKWFMPDNTLQIDIQ